MGAAGEPGFESFPAEIVTAMPALVASSSACSEGSATSQSGIGYEPTVVVFILAAFDISKLSKAL